MANYKDLIIPTINVNDVKVTIGSIQKLNLEYINAGEVLYCVETSKATEEFKPDFSGYVVLYVKNGDEVKVGDSAGIIYESLEDARAKNEELLATLKSLNPNIKASKKAIAYAKEVGFDLSLIHKDGLIKVEDIDNYLSTSNQTNQIQEKSKEVKNVGYKSNDVVLVGGGGLCLMLIDAIKAYPQYNIIGIVDDYAEIGSLVYGYPVFGAIKDTLPKLYKRGLRLAVNAIGAMVNSQNDALFTARVDMAKKIKEYGFLLPNIIHPKAIVESNCRLGEGNVILAGANIGSNSIIGDNCYINTNSMVSHECVIEDGVRIAPGAVLAGRIHVGKNTLVGMAATIYMNIKIGNNVIIYNGANITTNINDNEIIK